MEFLMKNGLYLCVYVLKIFREFTKLSTFYGILGLPKTATDLVFWQFHECWIPGLFKTLDNSRSSVLKWV